MMLGDNIKNIRLKRGYSQKYVAEKIGISEAYISLIETNKRTNLGTELLEKLSEVLGVDIIELYNDEYTGKETLQEKESETIGGNIRRYRAEKGFTQKELAEKSNLSRSYLADLERNRYNPSLESLKLIANSLGIEVSTLLGENPTIDLAKNIDDYTVDELELEFERLKPRIKDLPREEREKLIKIISAYLEE